ncbi:MAG: MarR family winged helix-turn-helix transcriptional regulator [Candidatus Ventricola sp.]
MTGAQGHLQRFNHLIGEIGALYHEAALKFGLPDSAMQVLYTVCVEGDECAIGEIIRQCGMSKQTLNSALRRLEEEGAICLEADSGRRKRVCLTKQGKALAEQTVRRLIEVENGIFETWTQEERDGYLGLTQRYLDALQRGLEALK